MEKLSAEQIKKALECCENELCDACVNCPAPPNTSESCVVFVMRQALALINSQEQRIKELTEENEGLTSSIKILVNNNADLEFELAQTYDLLEESKADTVRKMHSMLCEGRVSNDNVVIVANQVAKEMLEAANEKL